MKALKRVISLILSVSLLISVLPASSSAKSIPTEGMSVNGSYDKELDADVYTLREDNSDGVDLRKAPEYLKQENETLSLLSLTETVSGYCGGEGDGTNLTWSLTPDGVLTIAGSGVMADYNEVWAPWAEYKDSIYTLIISEGITSIGFDAFYGMASLTGELSLPESLTEIGQGAFYECTGLSGNLVIPDSVTEIKDYSFYGCTGLDGKLSLGKNTESIGVSAFCYCSALTGVLYLPETVTNIGDYAFYGMSSLTGELNLPESLIEIGEGAFGECTGLTGDLVIPDGVTEIKDYTFYGCTGLDGNLSLGKNMESIGVSAFYECIGLTGALNFPETIIYIDDYAFYACSGFTGAINLPAGLDAIAPYTFWGCSGFDSTLSIPASVTSIGEWAFYGCSSLTGELVLPTDLEHLGRNSFFDCSGFTGELIIPASVTEIGISTFYNCSGFTGDLIIPDKVTSIGNAAFYNCTGFDGALILPERITDIPYFAFASCTNLNGALVLPKSLATIGDYAFYNCAGFEGTLNLPNSIRSIGEASFACCDGFSDELYIPASVNIIGDGAFYSCSGIKDIYFYGNAPEITPLSEETGSFDINVLLHYADGQSGWTEAPAYDDVNNTWNGYPVSVWSPPSVFSAELVAVSKNQLTFDFNNSSSAIVFSAVYSEDGQMLSCGSKELEENAGITNIEMPIFNTSLADNAKVFFLDSSTTMSPVSESVSCNTAPYTPAILGQVVNGETGKPLAYATVKVLFANGNSYKHIVADETGSFAVELESDGVYFLLISDNVIADSTTFEVIDVWVRGKTDLGAISVEPCALVMGTIAYVDERNTEYRVFDDIGLFSWGGSGSFFYQKLNINENYEIHFLQDGCMPEVVTIKDAVGIINIGTINLTYIGFAGGDGTKANPYQIATAQQFNLMRSNPNAHYVLTADVDLSPIGSWIPIEKFDGSLDGNGHTVSNLTIHSAVQRASICSGVFANGSGQCSNVQFENVSIMVDLKARNRQPCHIGTIFGRLTYGSITNCSVTGSMNVTIQACEIDDELNRAAISGVGGIVGDSTSSCISNCISSLNISFTQKDGTINGALTTYDSPPSVGGICGVADETKILECNNSGNIDVIMSDHQIANAAGIVGETYSKTFINACQNKGSISIYCASTCWAGGITADSFFTTISDCINYGDIVSIAEDADGWCHAGGICGRGSSIENCYNYAASILAYDEGGYHYDEDGNYHEGVYGKAGRIVGQNGAELSNNYSIESTLVNDEIVTEDIGHDKRNGANLETAAVSATLSGQVIDVSGDGLADVAVTVYRGTTTTVSATTKTDASGSWRVSDLKVGSMYTVSFNRSDYTFSPTEIRITIKDQIEVADTIVASKKASGGFFAVSHGTVNGLVASPTGGHGMNITVSSVGNWTAETNSEWISVLISEGQNGDFFFPTIKANTTGLTRNGYITVRCEGFEPITIRVVQAAMDSELALLRPQSGDTFVHQSIVATWAQEATADHYYVVVRDLTLHPGDEGTAAEEYVVETTLTADTTAFTVDASHLMQGHTYRIQVAARDASNNVLANTNAEFSIMEASTSNKLGTPTPYEENTVLPINTNSLIRWNGVVNAEEYVVHVWDNAGNLIREETLTSEEIELAFMSTGQYWVQVYAKAEGYELSDVCNISVTVNCEHDWIASGTYIPNTGTWITCSDNTDLHYQASLRYYKCCSVCDALSDRNLYDVVSYKESEAPTKYHSYSRPVWNSYQYGNENEHMRNGLKTCVLCGYSEFVSDVVAHDFSDGACLCGLESASGRYSLYFRSNYYNKVFDTLQMDCAEVEVLIFDNVQNTTFTLSDMENLSLEFDGTNVRLQQGNGASLIRDDLTVSAYGMIELVNDLTGTVIDQAQIVGTVLNKEKENWLFLHNFTTVHNSTELITSNQAKSNTSDGEDILLFEGPEFPLITGSDCTVENYRQSAAYYDKPDVFPDGYYKVEFDVLNNTPMIWGVIAKYPNATTVSEVGIHLINANNRGVGVVSTNLEYASNLIETGGDILASVTEITSIKIEVPVGGYIQVLGINKDAKYDSPEAKVFVLNVLDAFLRVISIFDVTRTASGIDPGDSMLLIDQNRFVTAFLELVETRAIDPFDIMKDIAIVANEKELAGNLAKKAWFPILVDVISECTKKTVTGVGDTVANAVLAAGTAPVFAVSMASNMAVQSSQFAEKVVAMDPDHTNNGDWYINLIAMPTNQ